MRGHNIPDAHHDVRCISFTRLAVDPNDGTPVGILFSAFQRKDTEEGLSVTWLEYFVGDRVTQLTAAVHAIRASDFKPTKKSGFAVGNVAAIKAACSDRNHKIRIIHWPVDDNKAHAEPRPFPHEDQELLERLAADTWSDLVLNKDIPAGEAPAPDQPVA